MSLFYPLPLCFVETPWQESCWSRTFFLSGCGVWSPGASWGLWVCNVQGQMSVPCPPPRSPPPIRATPRDPHSWGNGITISLSLQAPAWTCGTCWTRARGVGGTWRPQSWVELGDRWGLGFRMDWPFLHPLLSWLQASSVWLLGYPPHSGVPENAPHPSLLFLRVGLGPPLCPPESEVERSPLQG